MTCEGLLYLQQAAGYKANKDGDLPSLAEIERWYIEFVLSEMNGSIPKASKVLDVAPSTLYRKIERWESPL